MSENQKKIWITGASTGIGKAAAEKFSKEGWKVAISARRAELLKNIAQDNNIFDYPLDVTDEKKVDEVFKKILENNPEDESYGHREISFSKNLYIERDDFKEEFNRKYFRLSIGKEVRLKNAYIIKGERVEKNDSGEIIKIYCTYDPKSKSGSGTEESLRKVKGTI